MEDCCPKCVCVVTGSPSWYTVTVHEVTGAPPLKPGVQPTTAPPSLGAAVIDVGLDGTVLGVMLGDAADSAPVPIAFVARTLNVFATPLVNPPTDADRAVPFGVVTAATAVPSWYAVTVYDVIGERPSSTGADHETVAPPSVGTAETPVGASGAVAALTVIEVGNPAADRSLVRSTRLFCTVSRK
jgi:hypothetical protein